MLSSLLPLTIAPLFSLGLESGVESQLDPENSGAIF